MFFFLNYVLTLLFFTFLGLKIYFSNNFSGKPRTPKETGRKRNFFHYLDDEQRNVRPKHDYHEEKKVSPI